MKEKGYTRSECRQSAVDALGLVGEERDAPIPDRWEIDYWQRDALIHALLALSAD